MSAVAKRSIVGLFALTKPIFSVFRHTKLDRSEFWFGWELEIGSSHDGMMTAVAKRLRLTRAATAPFVNATSLESDLEKDECARWGFRVGESLTEKDSEE